MENEKDNLTKAESKAIGFDAESKPVGYGSSMASDGMANRKRPVDKVALEETEASGEENSLREEGIAKRKDDITKAMDDEDRIGNRGL